MGKGIVLGHVLHVFLYFLSLANVGGDAAQGIDAAVLAPQWNFDCHENLCLPCEHVEQCLLCFQRLAMLQYTQIVLAHRRSGVCVEELVVVIAHDLSHRRSEPLTQQAVGKQVVSLHALHVDVGGDVLKDIGEQFFALLERLVGMAAAQRDLCQIGGLLDQSDLFIGRPVRQMMIYREGAEHFARKRTDGFRPARAQPGPGREFPIGRPVRMGTDIFNDDTLAGKGGGAKRSGAYAYPEPVDRIVVKIGQAGCRAVQQAFSPTVEQHDAAQHIWLLLLHAAHDGFQYRSERSATGQQLQHMVAGLFALLGLFAFGDVAGQPALDANDIQDEDSYAGNQQAREHYHPTALLQFAAVVTPHGATDSGTLVRLRFINGIVR